MEDIILESINNSLIEGIKIPRLGRINTTKLLIKKSSANVLNRGSKFLRKKPSATLSGSSPRITTQANKRIVKTQAKHWGSHPYGGGDSIKSWMNS